MSFRVLDLLIEMDTSVVSPSLLLPTLCPLVELIENAMKRKGSEVLQNKAVAAYVTICKTKVRKHMGEYKFGSLRLLFSLFLPSVVLEPPFPLTS